MTTTPNYTATDLVPTEEDLGANKVTFTGDRHHDHILSADPGSGGAGSRGR